MKAMPCPAQLELESQPPAQRHSPTSVAAAERIEPNAGTLRASVLAYLKHAGAATDEEMQYNMGLNPSTQRPRRVELVRAGLVYDSGRTRLTRSGRSAVVWRAV